MIGQCPYDCNNKNELGYCRSTGCVNPKYQQIEIDNLPIRQKYVNGEIVKDELLPDGTLIKRCVATDFTDVDELRKLMEEFGFGRKVNLID